MLFGKTKKLVIYPHLSTVDIYVDRVDQNIASFPISLYRDDAGLDLQTINDYIKKEKPTEVVILLTEEVMSTKSFVYDSKTNLVDKQEVIKLATDTVNFEIDTDNVEFSLEQTDKKTIIKSDLFQRGKFKTLENNLLKLNSLPDKVEYLSLSRALSRVVNNFYKQEYFCLYEYDKEEYVLILSKGDTLYLTNKIKGTHPELQKTINYSNLYFDKTVNRLFHIKNLSLEYRANENIEKAEFEESSIALQLKQPQNFPLPVVGAFILGQNTKLITKKTVISPPPIVPSQVLAPAPVEVSTPLPHTTLPVSSQTPPSMTFSPSQKNTKNNNSLPIIIAFVLAMLAVSALVWYIYNRDESSNQVVEITPTPVITQIPTPEPTAVPTLAPVNKALKFQVLNATEINGQAALIKEKIIKLGFKAVTTGNSTSKITENIIKVKKKYFELEEYFKQELPDFPATFDATLSETSPYDVVVTIGTDLSSPTSDSVTKTTKKVTPTSATEGTVEEVQ